MFLGKYFKNKQKIFMSGIIVALIICFTIFLIQYNNRISAIGWHESENGKYYILENNQISFDIEKELGVEIVGETKVKIAIEEDEEPWEDIVDDDIDKELDEINEDYI